MLWYILTALSPFVAIGWYQYSNYRHAKRHHAEKVAEYNLYKDVKYSSYRDPGEFKFKRKWKYDRYDFPALGRALTALFLTAILTFVTGSLISAWGPLHREEIGTFGLVAVNDGSKTSGSFFLFSGYIDEAQVYNFYEKLDDGGYKRGWQYANYSTIYQDAEPGTANLEQYHLVPNKWIGFTWQAHLRNNFHVPAGTIKEDLALDNVN
jgi:hypothetical protein